MPAKKIDKNWVWQVHEVPEGACFIFFISFYCITEYFTNLILLLLLYMIGGDGKKLTGGRTSASYCSPARNSPNSCQSAKKGGKGKGRKGGKTKGK